MSPPSVLFRVFLALFASAAALSLPEPGFAQSHLPAEGRGPEARRGPIEIYDDHVLAQGRLTLPAVSPTTLPAGVWSIDVSGLWSNTFSWTQDVPGEDPADRRFLLDGETVTFATLVRRGLGRHVDLGLRIPLQHRGGGTLDPFIDAWHRTFRLADAARPRFLRNAFRVEGLTTAGNGFAWIDATGTGLGNIELNARWRTIEGGGHAMSAAIVGRLSLPTASGPYRDSGLGAGAQLVADAPLGRTADLYLGTGLTLQDAGPVRGLVYERARVQGFAAFEWRPWPRVSLIAETNIASRLVRNIDSYPGVHWLVNGEVRVRVGKTMRLDLGLTENLIAQQSTTDLAFFLGMGWRP